VIRFVCASANPHKVAEMGEVLAGVGIGLDPRPADLADVDECADTLEGNARLKAVAVCAATGRPALADDTGLEVAALDGAPGVRSARYAGDGASAADNTTKLLRELAEVGDDARSARFRTVVLVAYPDGSERVAEGLVEGVIVTQPRGEAGFGYDPVFVPDDGDGRTFAEMTAEEKHAISHRGRALRALAEALR